MKIVAFLRAAQYDGSNSASLLTTIGGDVTIVSESAGVLTLDTCGNTRVVHTGDWVRYSDGCVQQVYTPAAFSEVFLQENDLVNAEDVPQTGVRSIGFAAVPALLLGASANVAVTMSPALPDSSYAATARIVGAVGSLTVTSVVVTDEDTVTVTVHAGVAYVAGAQVCVWAL